jgi:hypothetical protein
MDYRCIALYHHAAKKIDNSQYHLDHFYRRIGDHHGKRH